LLGDVPCVPLLDHLIGDRGEEPPLFRLSE
jgi:hypothetical protein